MRTIAFCACCIVGALTTHAQHASQVLLDLPDSIDFAFVAKDADALADSPPLAILVELSDSESILSGAQAAAGAIADLIGTDTESLTRDILAQQFILCSSVGQDDRREWAIQFDTSGALARQIRALFPNRPRAVLDGVPTFDVSNGAFRVAVFRQPQGTTRFIVSPSSSMSLFRTMILQEVTTRRVPAIRSTERAGSLRSLPANNVAIVSSRDALKSLGLINDPAINLKPVADGFPLVLAGSVQPGKVACTVLAEASLVLGQGSTEGTVEPWPFTTFATMTQGADLAVIEHAELGFGIASEVFDSLIDSEFSAARGGAPDEVLGGLDTITPATARVALGLYPGSVASKTHEVFLAVEVSDVGQAARFGDDALIRRFAGSAEQPLVEPAAIRSIDLTQLLGPFARLTYGDSVPESRWTFRRSPRAEAQHPGEARGWWTIGIGADERRFFEATSIFSDERDLVQALPWVSLGIARPARILETAERSPQDPIALLTEDRSEALQEAFVWIDTLSWKVMRTRNGIAIGSITIEYSDPDNASDEIEP